MTRDYINEDADAGAKALRTDWYEVEVEDARPAGAMKDDLSFTIFLDLKVTSGPDKGAVTSVSLWFPPSGHKGAFHFKKKARAWLPLGVADDLSGDDEIAATCEALIGRTANASLGSQSKGAYKGSQELLETRPLGQAIEVPDAADDDEEPEEPKVGTRRGSGSDEVGF